VLPSHSVYRTKRSTEQSSAGIGRGMAKIWVLCEPFWVRGLENVKMFSLFSVFLFDCSGGLSRHLSIHVFSVLGLFLCSGDGGVMLQARRMYS
jgi:hypothetical protein